MNNYTATVQEETAATFELTAVDVYRRHRGEEHCNSRYQYVDVSYDMDQLQRAILNDSIGGEYYFMIRDNGTWLTSSEEFLNEITNQYNNYDLYGVNIYIKDGELVYKPLSYECVRDGKKVLK